MTDITFSSDITVKLIRSMASDDMVVQAAQVSSKGENNPETVPQRLIDSLMFGGHGSPFEHNAFTFFSKAPIFVYREWWRHRMSSINEMSGRYTVLPGEFYIPSDSRKLFNIGTKMKPDFVSQAVAEERGYILEGYDADYVQEILRTSSSDSWTEYERMLEARIAPEVARMVLPVNIYSQAYWTVNARSLMNFLSLRVESDDSLRRSYPQIEIQMPAEIMEKAFAELMPATYSAFVRNGRVAP
jgi:thymidylate synthase (FAD)